MSDINVNFTVNTVSTEFTVDQFSNVVLTVDDVFEANFSVEGVYNPNGGAVGGSNTQFQYNNQGVLAGANTVTYANGNITLGDVGNVRILGGASNAKLTTDGTGNLFWQVVDGNVIGGVISNVAVNADGNVTISSNLLPNIITVSSNSAFAETYIANDVTISGNLTVGGNVTYTGVTSLTVESPLIDVGGGPNRSPLIAADPYDRGLVLHTFSNGIAYTVTATAEGGSNTFTSNTVVGVRVGEIIWGVDSLNRQVFTANSSVTSVDAANSTVTIDGEVVFNLPALTQVYQGQDRLAFIGLQQSSDEIVVSTQSQVVDNQVSFIQLANVRGDTWLGNVLGNNITSTQQLTANSIFANTANISNSVVTSNITAGAVTSNTVSALNNINSPSVVAGSITGSGNVMFTGNLVSLGSNSTVRIDGGNSGQVLSTDGTGALIWVDQSNIAPVPYMTWTVNVTANNQSFENNNLANYSLSEDVALFRNGVYVDPIDYVLSGNTLTVNVLLYDDDMLAIIRQGSATGGAGGGGDYSNANVSRYLAVYNGNLQANNFTGGNITASASLTSSNSLSVVGVTNFGGNVYGTNAFFSEAQLGAINSFTITANLLTINERANLGNIANVTITGGSNNQVLSTNGNGVLRWANGISVAAGTTQQLQFNFEGNLAGATGLLYDPNLNRLSASNGVTVSGNSFFIGAATIEGNATVNATLTGAGNTQLTGANVYLGSVANLHIAGGIANQFLQTDGTGNLVWSTVATGTTYGNSNVANYLPTYTGNMTFANANLKITGGSNTQYLQTDGAGNLSWSSISTSSISNGNSNVTVLANGNVLVSSNGQANILVVSSDGTRGSTVIQNDVSITGNLSVQGNTIYANTDTLVVSDPIISLGVGSNGAVLTSQDNKDRGLALHTYGNGNTYTSNGIVPIGSTLIAIDDTRGILVGMPVTTLTGAIPSGTVIANVDANSLITLSAATTQQINNNQALQIGYDTIRFTGWDHSNLEFVVASNANINSEIVTVNDLANLRASTVLANIISTGNSTFSGNVSLGSNANVRITGGSNAQVLTTDGQGNLRWQTATAAANGALPQAAAAQFSVTVTGSPTADSFTDEILTFTFGATYTPSTATNTASRGQLTSRNWFSMGMDSTGRAVTVANGSDVAATSTDWGATWTERTLPASRTWTDVAWGDTGGSGTWVAVAASSNRGAYSTDGGVTWTEMNMPTTTTWSRVVYGGGRFVAIAGTYEGTASSTSIAATSADGITWTQRTLPATTGWSGLTYGNGQFVAVAYGSTSAATSPDGVTWTSRTLSASGNWFDIAWNGSVYAVSGFSTTSILTSPDGVTWTTRSAVVGSVHNIAAINGVFVAFPWSSTEAWVSTNNGVNWSSVSGFNSGQYIAVAGSGSAFLAVSRSNIYSTLITRGTSYQITLPAHGVYSQQSLFWPALQGGTPTPTQQAENLGAAILALRPTYTITYPSSGVVRVDTNSLGNITNTTLLTLQSALSGTLTLAITEGTGAVLDSLTITDPATSQAFTYSGTGSPQTRSDWASQLAATETLSGYTAAVVNNPANSVITLSRTTVGVVDAADYLQFTFTQGSNSTLAISTQVVSGGVGVFNTGVLYNNNNTIAGSESLTYVAGTQTLTVNNLSVANTGFGAFSENYIDGGTVSGTLVPNVAAATIYRYTLSGNITITSLNGARAGTSATIILTQDSTGNRTLTATDWRFASNIRALSTAANSTDIMFVFYDGTTYWATLATGYV